jgi:ankyrin repeat protein
MKRILVLLLALAPAFLQAQNNTLLGAEFWKTQPDLATVKAEIAKGNNPAEANRGNFDVVTMAINNNAKTDVIKYLIEQEGNSVKKKTHDGRIYLHWAASRGNVEIVNYLLQKGSDINFGDDRGTIPMVFAIGNGQTNKEVYEAFFKAGNNPKQKFQNGTSLLLLAIANDKELLLSDYLVTKGLAYSDTDELGRTAFDYAARSGNLELLKKLKAKGVKNTQQALLLAAQGGRSGAASLDVYKYLVEELKIPAAATGENGETVLHHLVRKPKQEEQINYFLSKGVDINKADKSGNTAFMVVANTRNTELAKSLLPKVKNINTVNNKGETALLLSVQNSSSEMVGLLLENGASTAVVSKEGNLGYYLVQSYRAPRAGELADDFSKKLVLLQAKGVDLSAPQPDGNTLYHLAVAKNELALFKALEPLKIDVNAKNKESMTALHRAAMMAKDDAILKYLLSLGAKKELLTELDETAFDLAKENEYLTEQKITIDFLK